MTSSLFMEHRKDVYSTVDFQRLVTSFVIGDGGLYRPKNKRQTEYRAPKPTNALYGMSQLKSHIDYVLYQMRVMSQLTKMRVLVIPANGMHKESIRMVSMTHPFYTDLYERLYGIGRKALNWHDLQLFDLQSLAHLIMDDGYVDQKSKYSWAYGIATDSFSEPEVKLLRDIIADRLNLHANVRRYRNTYRLIFNAKESGKTRDAIAPYIAPSFYYKIKETPTIETVATWANMLRVDGIVRTLLKDSDLYRNVID